MSTGCGFGLVFFFVHALDVCKRMGNRDPAGEIVRKLCRSSLFFASGDLLQLVRWVSYYLLARCIPAAQPHVPMPNKLIGDVVARHDLSHQFADLAAGVDLLVALPCCQYHRITVEGAFDLNW